MQQQKSCRQIIKEGTEENKQEILGKDKQLQMVVRFSGYEEVEAMISKRSCRQIIKEGTEENKQEILGKDKL